MVQRVGKKGEVRGHNRPSDHRKDDGCRKGERSGMRLHHGNNGGRESVGRYSMPLNHGHNGSRESVVDLTGHLIKPRRKAQIASRPHAPRCYEYITSP